MNQILENLPHSWSLVELRDILLDIQYGYTVSASNEKDSFKLLRITDLQNNSVDWDSVPYCQCDEAQKYLLKAGDIVVARTGATTGKSYLLSFIPQPSVFASYLIRLHTSQISPPEYISWFMRSPYYWQQIIKVSKGSAQPGANSSILSKLKLPFPPLNEQRRIVTKIEELTDRTRKAREALEDVPQLIEQFRRSVLAAAFRGDLTADWREQNPDVEPAEKLLERIRVERRQRWEAAELEKMRGKGKEPGNDLWKKKYNECPLPKFSDLPLIPRSWAWSGFSQLGEINRGKSKHRPRKDPILFGGDYPFIQTGDVSRANGEIKAFSKTYNEVGLKQSCLWPKNTLCITIAANIAETGILTFESCFPDSIVGFIADPKICEVRFVELFIRTVKGKLERFAPATAQKNINLEILKDLAIPVPPLEEQRKILTLVDYQFSIIHRLEEIWQQNYQDFEKVDRAILAKAFRGQLVPQDPTDEPASQLLQRIRTEREKLTPKEKPVKKQKRC
jgi:type I restriction enzyme S subunit